MIFLLALQSSRGERYSGGNIREGGKRGGKKGVISALKIVSFPSFLSPGSSKQSVRTCLRPHVNDLPGALTGSFFNVPFRLPHTQ